MNYELPNLFSSETNMPIYVFGSLRIRRIVVIDPDKVKPNSEAFKYFKRHAKECGKTDCISIVGKKVIVSELACAVCVCAVQELDHSA